MSQIFLHTVSTLSQAHGIILDLILGQVARARGRGHPFTIAVSGGQSPQLFYEFMGRQVLDYNGWRFLFADERLVKHSDPASNYALVKKLWLGPAGVPAEVVYPVETAANVTAGQAACAYEHLLRSVFCDEHGGLRLHVALLGMGADGHIASLFPGDPALTSRQWVAAVQAPAVLPPAALPPKSPFERITLTLEALVAAELIIFLLAGKNKKVLLQQALTAKTPDPHLPVTSLFCCGRPVHVFTDSLDGVQSTMPLKL